MSKGSAIVVSYNSAENIESCLEALCEQTGWEILLFDNASTDDTLARASKFGERVRIVAANNNCGFAQAANEALSMITSDTAILLNPDAVPHPGALDYLADAVRDSSVGAAGGLLIGPDSRPQRGFVIRRFPTLASVACETLLLNQLWPRNPINRRYRYLDADYTRAQAVDQPAGAALAFRREAWQKVGGFDKQFSPVWFEDVDFCLRLQQAGWRVVYEPRAVFTHTGGHSVRRLSFSDRQLFWYSNLLRFFRKHHGAAQCVILRIVIMIGMLIRSATAVAIGQPSSVSRREAIEAYLLVFRECMLGDATTGTTAPLPKKNSSSEL